MSRSWIDAHPRENPSAGIAPMAMLFNLADGSIRATSVPPRSGFYSQEIASDDR
jgi:hypothetical protein